MISYLADHGEDLIGGWVHRQDNYSPPEKTNSETVKVAIRKVKESESKIPLKRLRSKVKVVKMRKQKVLMIL